MSRSYRKHPIQRWECRTFNHKQMNRSFRRTSIEDTPPNGKTYKLIGRNTNRWDWKAMRHTRKDAIREWETWEREGRNYKHYTLEEYLQCWEKWCRRK